MLRDRPYLDWLKKRHCAVVGHSGLERALQPIDPAHGPSSGMRVKGPDNEAVPMCRTHHLEQHRIGWPAFEAKEGFSREAEARAFWAAWLIVKEGMAS